MTKKHAGHGRTTHNADPNDFDQQNTPNWLEIRGGKFDPRFAPPSLVFLRWRKQ